MHLPSSGVVLSYRVIADLDIALRRRFSSSPFALSAHTPGVAAPATVDLYVAAIRRLQLRTDRYRRLTSAVEDTLWSNLRGRVQPRRVERFLRSLWRRASDWAYSPDLEDAYADSGTLLDGPLLQALAADLWRCVCQQVDESKAFLFCLRVEARMDAFVYLHSTLTQRLKDSTYICYTPEDYVVPPAQGTCH